MIHTGATPWRVLRDLNSAEKHRYRKEGYVKYEKYPANAWPLLGHYYTAQDLTGCGQEVDGGFLLDNSTYCPTCRKHFPIEQFTQVPT